MGKSTLSKREYAERYDEIAASMYRFALCVTGDSKEAEAAMAKLFCEGYAGACCDDFDKHMLAVLRRILERFASNNEDYSKSIKGLLPDRKYQKLIDILCKLSMSQRATLLQKLMFEYGAKANTVC